jgi:hypothetical protein
VAKNFVADRPQVFRIPKRRFDGPVSAWSKLEEIAQGEGTEVQELFARERLSDEELAAPVLD